MLKDVIEFVQSRTDLESREAVLREINYAWSEIWNSDDLPNSVFEMTVKADDTFAARITLPWYVGKLRAVKNASRIRITLNTPRPYYQDESYVQSPYTWRELGVSPLKRSIENATRIIFRIAEAESAQFKITIIGPDDNAEDVRDQLIVPVGTLEVTTTRQFTDATSIVKDRFTSQNVLIVGANGEDLGLIPNSSLEARNTIYQIHDKCTQCCASCNCFDVLFKKPAPLLYYDEQVIPYQEVLMAKTLEWITLPKEGQEKKAMLYGDKSKTLLQGFNTNEVPGTEHKVDLGRNLFTSWSGSGTRKI